MRNTIVKELSALLGIDKTYGLPYQPTFQAPTEKDHSESKLTITCILEDSAASRPTEWEFLVPAVEHLKMITPYSKEIGLCPRDLDHGRSLATDMNRDLVPFEVASCGCESELAANLFANFLQLLATFDRYVGREAEQRVAEENRGAHKHEFEVGETERVHEAPGGLRIVVALRDRDHLGLNLTCHEQHEALGLELDLHHVIAKVACAILPQ